MKNEWIDVTKQLPKLKTYFDKEWGGVVKEVSIEVIVTDGETAWADYYSEDLGFHESITHWMELPKPPNL